ncbi:MAG TPA: hypothetical protein VE988_27875 [Gemmataceae bacterium]|nr:hypothetical protein [Gemmataceae bacterium]
MKSTGPSTPISSKRSLRIGFTTMKVSPFGSTERILSQVLSHILATNNAIAITVCNIGQRHKKLVCIPAEVHVGIRAVIDDGMLDGALPDGVVGDEVFVEEPDLEGVDFNRKSFDDRPSANDHAPGRHDRIGAPSAKARSHLNHLKSRAGIDQRRQHVRPFKEILAVGVQHGGIISAHPGGAAAAHLADREAAFEGRALQGTVPGHLKSFSDPHAHEVMVKLQILKGDLPPKTVENRFVHRCTRGQGDRLKGLRKNNLNNLTLSQL